MHIQEGCDFLYTLPSSMVKECVKECVIAKSSIHACTLNFQDGYTPFALAFECGNVHIVEHLSDMLTQQFLKDIMALCVARKTTALHVAAAHNAVGIAEQLIGAGCPLNAADVNVSYCEYE